MIEELCINPWEKYNDMMLGISVKSDYTSKASRISVNNAVAIIKALNSFHLATRGLECVGTGVFSIEWWRSQKTCSNPQNADFRCNMWSGHWIE